MVIPGIAKRSRIVASVLAALVYLVFAMFPHVAQARFELIKEWVLAESLENGSLSAPFPGWQLADGMVYLWDDNGPSPYRLWRLEGTTLTPVTGFNFDFDRFVPNAIFSQGDRVVLSGTFDGVQGHWSIVGDDVISMEPLLGPVPFYAPYLWTPTDAGVVISARTDEHGRELWLMSEDGYQLIADLNPGAADSHPGSAGWDAVPIYDWHAAFTGAQGPQSRLMFSLDDGSSGSEPWVFDAADQSLTQVGDLVAGEEASHPWWLGSVGETQYFGIIDRQIFRSDETTAISIDDRVGLFSYGSPSSQHNFVLDGALHAWWGPHAFDSYGYITRINPDDSIEFFRARRFPASPTLELDSVFPFDGAAQIVSGSTFLKLQGSELVESDLFTGKAGRPGVITWSESEVLFEEEASGVFQGDVYCLVNDQSVAMWRKPQDIPYAGHSVVRRGGWVYLRTSDPAAIEGEAGGRAQLWGMPFPGGCQQAWPEEFHINASLNDAWYSPDTPGQGFFITVFEEQGTVFAAWFTYDAERPPANVQAILAEPGHRWLTAYGPYQGAQADLELEKTSGGIFNSAQPEVSQVFAGILNIRFTGCNSAVVEFLITDTDPPQSIPAGSIEIERIAPDNVAACEQAIARQ